jgi:hypothetical protein
MKRDLLDFPTAEKIAEAKALSRSCKHRVKRKVPRMVVQIACLQCGATQDFKGAPWTAPIRTPRLRRVK